MGRMDDYNRKHQQQSTTVAKLKIFLLVLITNLITVYFLAGTPFNWPDYTSGHIHNRLPDSSTLLLQQLNFTQLQLAHAESTLSSVQRRLVTSNALLETLLTELSRAQTSGSHNSLHNDNDGWPDELFGELKLAVGPHKLPLGHSPNLGTDELYLPLGAGCRRLQEDVIKYMTYTPGEECPSDDVFAQKLMLRGCEPLPRRRCHPKSPVGYIDPQPLPTSLWSTPADTSIVWDPYTCKNYDCLVNRAKDPGSYDCKDCFDLNGREKSRWIFDTDSLDYSIDAVLNYKPPGTIRIGLDLGGGSGTFAARMKERNVTIITSTMNFDGPFNSFIASRGLIPIHISIAHRLPFFENTLDVVHSMHVLSNWIPDDVLEFALFDIYRVLRPGGLFWLDHFFCVGQQLNGTYVPMFNRIGFKKVRWNAGRKLDRGVELNEWYLSALLEKPMT